MRAPTYTLVALLCSVSAIAACGDDGTKTDNAATNNAATNNAATNNAATNNAATNNAATNNADDCPAGEELCGGDCIDTASSVDHCGACGEGCEGGPNTVPACVDGQCELTCEQGFIDTGDPEGTGCEPECVPTNNGVEACDGIDNDCDDEVDEDFTDLGNGCTVGEGVCEASGTIICNAAMDGTRCDATEGMPAVTTESTCDGLDENCDGTVDEGCDDDGDGWCDADFTVEATTAECMNGTQVGDCHDDDPDIYPGSTAFGCDGFDNDCDGSTDEIDPVGDTPAASFTFTGVHDTSPSDSLPAVMSAPSNEGFCIAAYDDADDVLLIAHVKSDGTSSELTLNLAAGVQRDLMDVHWGLGLCGVLYRHPNGLQLVTWNTSDAAPTFDHTVDGGSTASLLGTDNRGARLFMAALGNGMFQALNWVILYTATGETQFGDEYWNVDYRTLLFDAEFQSQLSDEQSVTTSVGPNAPDVDVGRSPVSTDDFLVALTIDGAFSETLSVYSVDGAGTLTYRPDLSDAAGVRLAINSANDQVHVMFDDVDAGAWTIREVTDQYQYDVTGTLSYQTFDPPEYASSHLLAHHPATPSSLWFLDPIDEATYQMEDLGSGTYGFTDHDHPADCTQMPCAAHRELLAVDTKGEFIEVVTKDPATDTPQFHINQFSCH